MNIFRYFFFQMTEHNHGIHFSQLYWQCECHFEYVHKQRFGTNIQLKSIKCLIMLLKLFTWAWIGFLTFVRDLQLSNHFPTSFEQKYSIFISIFSLCKQILWRSTYVEGNLTIKLIQGSLQNFLRHGRKNMSDRDKGQ